MIWLSGRPLAALLFSERRGLEKTWTLALEIWKVCGCGDKLQFFLHLLTLQGVQLLHSLDSGRSRLTVIEILLVHVDLLTLSQSCFKNAKVLSMFQVMLEFWLEETFEGHTIPKALPMDCLESFLGRRLQFGIICTPAMP